MKVNSIMVLLGFYSKPKNILNKLTKYFKLFIKDPTKHRQTHLCSRGKNYMSHTFLMFHNSVSFNVKRTGLFCLTCQCNMNKITKINLRQGNYKK